MLGASLTCAFSSGTRTSSPAGCASCSGTNVFLVAEQAGVDQRPSAPAVLLILVDVVDLADLVALSVDHRAPLEPVGLGDFGHRRSPMDVGHVCHKVAVAVPLTPESLNRIHRSGRECATDRTKLAHLSHVRHTSLADGYGVGSCPRPPRIAEHPGRGAPGERARAAARRRARQPRAHPRRGRRPGRRPSHDDGRDRRGRRRRALDALPPLPDPRGPVRRARAGGRGASAPAPQPSGRVAPLPYQAPGRLGRAQPLALEVTHVLDEVPPHLIADQLVAEARRAAGVAVALYIVDIDGSQLIRLAAPRTSPRRSRRRRRWGPRSCPRGCRRSTRC